jgi:methionyl-tRNA formyltransferase
VSAQARGVDPWPGATTTLNGEPLKLFAPRLAAGAPADPGVVREAGNAGLVVACGDGTAVAFAELQFPGKRRMPAGLARDRLPPGTRLGS